MCNREYRLCDIKRIRENRMFHLSVKTIILRLTDKYAKGFQSANIHKYQTDE